MAFKHGMLTASLALAIIASGAIVTSAASPDANGEAPAAIATIAISHGSGGLMIEGGALALADGDFQAKMTIDKHGRSGSMKTSQGGTLSLKAGESGSVAKVGVSYQPGDQIDVKMDITAGGKPVSATRTVVN